MDGNGWTGLNPEVAKSNIQSFDSACANWVVAFREKYYNFMDQLRYLWASPNAVKEEGNINGLVADFCDLFHNRSAEICLNAARAYNIVAAAHGAPTISENFIGNNYNSGGHLMIDYKSLDGSRNGITGINQKMVRDHLLPNFKASFDALARELDSLPSSIALYDDEDGQQHAYTSNISEFEKKFSGLVDEIWSKIQNALETEVDNARLAKEQATQTLNG